MGGCTNCSGKAACDDHKGSMMSAVDRALGQIYPSRTWGEPDDRALADVSAARDDDLEGLADELATELRAPTFVRRGDDAEPCDYIYVLCLGRAPCAVQVRDHDVPAPAEWASLGDDDAISEQYLRVCIAQRAPLAAVQQVAVDVRRSATGYVVHERPRAGVYDAPLLPRMQKLVAILPAYGLTHVDFGDIAHAPPGFHAGVWRELYAGEPAIANYLFFPQPATMVTTSEVAPELA